VKENNLNIWSIGHGSDTIERLRSKDQADTEGLLEEVFVKHPETLLPDLTLIGRQTSTDAGYPDLLGVDGDGRLVVFELKRGTLTREAVAQLLDYGSHLESLNDEQLATLIASESGKNGVDKIENFNDWYSERLGEPLEKLRPVRMVLVGLGADDRARRIVKFLQDGFDISLVLFHGFSHRDRTLLARHVETTGTNANVSGGRRLPRPSRHDLVESLRSRANELGIQELWEDVTRCLQVFERPPEPTKSGLTSYPPKRLEMPELLHASAAHATHSVTLEPSSQKVRVTFFPAAVELCLHDFEDKKGAIPFQQEVPPNAPVTERVDKQWYILLDEQGWRAFREDLVELAEDIGSSWQKRLGEGPQQHAAGRASGGDAD
jgi:hypothetical protein